MAVWVDPFTGQAIDTDVAPVGGPTPAGPGGYAIYQGDPSDPASLTPRLNAGWSFSEGNTPFTGGYGFEADRGATFYFPGDEWSIIQSYGDLGNLQAALAAAGVLDGDYIEGMPDGKTAAAMKKVLEAANAAGLSWDQVLRGGLDAAAQKAAGRGGGGGSGGGGGGGAAAVTDEDIIALANQTAQGVLGRNLRGEEVGAFIPAFRSVLGSGTSPQVSAENLIRQETAPAEAGAHDVGNVMGALSKLLGG